MFMLMEFFGLRRPVYITSHPDDLWNIYDITQELEIEALGDREYLIYVAM